MKKKMPILFVIGIALNMAGILLMRPLADWEYNWVPIAVSAVGLVLVIISVALMRKG